MNRIIFIAVDLQNEFASKGGSHFVPRPSVGFVKDVLIGFLRKKGIRTAEIISDYRQPRPGDPRDICRPGEWGYESIIPRDIVKNDVWVKCMNPPIWVRDNIGDPEKEPGIPYQDPKRFDSWLSENVGSPGYTDNIVLFGLTLDRCVLCVAQELAFRGYTVKILAEGTDTASGDKAEKERMLKDPPLVHWAEPISWGELKVFYS